MKNEPIAHEELQSQVAIDAAVGGILRHQPNSQVSAAVLYPIQIPALTSRTTPVIAALRGDARNSTASATSSGSTNRRSADWAAASAATSSMVRPWRAAASAKIPSSA